jgi:hypothetical protein
MREEFAVCTPTAQMMISKFTRLARILHILVALPLLSFSVLGQEKPAAAKTDFSGRWRMVKEKSNFGSFHMPDIVVQVVEQHGTTMNVHTVQTTGTKTTTADVVYFIDGNVSKNVINGRDSESRTFWDGAALVVRTTTKNSKHEDTVMEDRWELSDDSQTLTRTSHVETTNGQADMKLVSVKEKLNH